jgi:hypothetical protein
MRFDGVSWAFEHRRVIDLTAWLHDAATMLIRNMRQPPVFGFLGAELDRQPVARPQRTVRFQTR